MNSFWRFLRDKRNQQVLGWLGGGLVVVATGLWAVFVYLFPAEKSSEAKSPEPTPPSIQADRGRVAIGGNVTGATITSIGGSVTGSTINIIGVPPEQLAALIRQGADLSETQKKLIAKLEGELDLNQRQIRAALSILGENDIPPERLAAKLVEVAGRFKALQETAFVAQDFFRPGATAITAIPVALSKGTANPCALVHY